MSTTRTSTWPMIWMLVFMALLILEGVAIGRAESGDTLSEIVRNDVRFDLVGRFIFLPIWTWLTWHWVLRPQGDISVGWRDLVALLIGLVWAYVEYRR
jgi:hypothetical protein